MPIRPRLGKNIDQIGDAASDILNLVLTGLTTGVNTVITVTDTILVAFQNLQAQILVKEDKLLVPEEVVDDYTLVLADKSKQKDFNKGTALSCTIPPNASVAFEIGTIIVACQKGAGQLSFIAGVGVTIQSADSFLSTRVQFSHVYAHKIATNTWRLVGDLA